MWCSATAPIPIRPARSRIPAPSLVAGGAAVVAYVLGTRGDPQDLDASAPHLVRGRGHRHPDLGAGGEGRGGDRRRRPTWPRRARDPAAGRPADLLGQAARRRRAHAAPGGGAARGRVPGARRGPWRPGRGLLPPRPGPVHHRARPAAPADAGRAGVRQRGRARRRACPGWPPAIRSCMPRTASRPGPPAGSGTAPARCARRGPDRASRRRLHHPGADRLPAPGHLEPDQVLVVSDQWRRILEADYAVSATVVRNGVDLRRYQSADSAPGGGPAGARRRGRPAADPHRRRHRAAQGQRHAGPRDRPAAGRRAEPGARRRGRALVPGLPRLPGTGVLPAPGAGPGS